MLPTKPSNKNNKESDLPTLLEENLDRLNRFVRRTAGPLLRAKESVSDITQSVCRELLNHAGRFTKGGEKGFRSWLYTTARRKIYDRNDYHRAAKRDVGRERTATGEDRKVAPEDLGHLETPSQDAIARENLELLQDAYSRLSIQDQEIIRLSRFDGHSHKEIAEILELSLDAVYQRLSRALARLETILSEKE